MRPGPPLDDRRLQQTLLDLEAEVWRALSSDRGADFFRQVLTPQALMVLPGAVLEKDRALRETAAAPPWATYHIEDPRILRLTEQSAVLTYRATARRDHEPEYRALMTSVYVESCDKWKLAFHQQTPLLAK